MEVTPVLAFKVFVSATATAGLLNMYTVQQLKSNSRKFSSVAFGDTNLRWASALASVRYIIGGSTIAFMKTRTVFFPIFELMFGALVLANLYTYGPSGRFIRTVIFLVLALPLAIISGLDEPGSSITPNSFTYSGISAGLLTSLVPGLMDITIPGSITALPSILTPSSVDVGISLAGLTNSLAGVAVGGGILWLVPLFYYRFRHVEGLGLGNVKTAMMIGAFCGYQGALLSIFVASLLGSIFALPYIALGRLSMRSRIAFTPFQIVGGVLAVLWSRPIILWYAGLYSK